MQIGSGHYYLRKSGESLSKTGQLPTGLASERTIYAQDAHKIHRKPTRFPELFLAVLRGAIWALFFLLLYVMAEVVRHG